MTDTETLPLSLVYPYPYGDPRGWCKDVADPHLVQHGAPTGMPEPNGTTAWLVTRYTDVRMALSDRRFGRAPATKLAPPRVNPARYCRATLLPASDPPEHTRLRRLFNDPFTSARVERWRERVQQLADAHFGEIASAGFTGDLVRHVYDPLALALLGDVMGIPSADRAELLTLSSALHATEMTAEDFHNQMDATARYFDGLVAWRRQHPGDDVVTEALHNRTARGDDISSDADIASMAAGMFATGVAALSGQLQISTQALLRHPQQWARLRAEPELLPFAVDEVLRYAPLIIGPLRARYVREDVDLGGRRLRAGDLVAASSSAANVDPHAFPDPYRLDISRRGLPILAFAFGIHFCQAASFVRMAMGAVLSSLVAHFTDLHLAVPDEQLRWNRGRRLRSFRELPVRW